MTIATGARWNDEAISTATGAVQTVVDLGHIQRQRFHDRQAEITHYKHLEVDLRRWYAEAARVIVLGIKRHAPEQEAELRKLLDL